MKVLIIPEDPTHDAFILAPVMERLFDDLGRRPRIEVLRDPHMRGTNDVFNHDLIGEVIEDNRMVDLCVLVVDRDGDRKGNVGKAEAVQKAFPAKLVVCVAVQEVEVWMLALYRAELGVPWSDVRAHFDPKEAYSDPLIASKGWAAFVGRGRKEAMRAIAGQWTGLLTVCPELADLKVRIGAWLQARP